MDADTTSLSDTHTDATAAAMSPAESTAMDDPSASTATTLEWANTDATSLAPTNVAIAKVQRAWERKAQSPFSRRRFKVGKIFKRNQQTAGPSAFAAPFNVHIRAPTSNGDGTPLKAVKKLRIASDAPSGFGSIVSNWEGRGSPTNRRIVTRASLSRGDGEELIALADEDGQEVELASAEEAGDEEEEFVEGTTIEIINEDGTTGNNSIESADSDEWEYESATEADDEEETERQVALALQRNREDNEQARLEACGMAIAGLGEPLYYGPRRQGRNSVSPTAAPSPPVMSIDEHNWTPPGSRARLEAVKSTNDAAKEEPPASEDTSKHDGAIKETVARQQLPEGFVSPATVRRRPIEQVRQQNASRRRTLPKDFAAKAKRQSAPSIESAPQEAATTEADEQPRSESRKIHIEHNFTPEEEEDIRRGLRRQDRVPREQTPETEVGPSMIHMEAATPLHQTIGAVQDQSDLSPGKLPGSPVPTISGAHPRLPLRRSPRRQSTSPIKRKSILKTSGNSHLIAFTPIKVSLPEHDAAQQAKAVLASSPLPTSLPASFSGFSAVEDSEMPTVTRSSSAPPESPQMSPRKPYQPRISDDTALLEAFLKRASESKTGKRLSDTARRESLERRRESDVVPQALASSPVEKPATPKTDVLAEMDPNSPSPRKQLAGFNFGAAAPAVQTEDKQDPIQDDEDELAAETGPPRKFASRKSGRTKKRPDGLSAADSQSGPRRISIKASTDGVVLKKTEAQELSQQTRKNTKDNKKDAVLPPQRLKGLAIEQASLPEIMEVEHPPGRRGITWSETLVAFYQGGEEPEVSMMVDELGGESEIGSPGAQEGEAGSTEPPPASQTPSRPRQRRLKAPRQTASNNVKSEAVEAPPDAAETKAKPKVKRKIPRPATPGKALKTSSILPQPDDADTKTQAEPEPEPKKAATANTSKKATSAAPTKKSAVPSKLPAPASTAAATGLASGKENSLIASPPKKRMTKTSAVAAAGPVKGLSSVPKFDLGKPAAKATEEKEAREQPGLMSPAKKAPKLMAPVTRSGADVSHVEEGLGGNVNGLGSPAKKRTRRMLG